MNRDPGILCFTHCTEAQIFQFSVPQICPVCHADLKESTSLMPVRVPYPFVNARQHNCSIVIRPTQGDFLSHYSPGDDLHIGVTSSNGRVYEFDDEGIHRGTRDGHWVRSVLVRDFQQEFDETRQDLWDSTLETVTADDAWSMSKYNEESFNCFSFVLSFLENLPFASDLNMSVANQVNFCDTYVKHKISTAYKYIIVYRAVKNYGYFVGANDNNFSLA